MNRVQDRDSHFLGDWSQRDKLSEIKPTLPHTICLLHICFGNCRPILSILYVQLVLALDLMQICLKIAKSFMEAGAIKRILQTLFSYLLHLAQRTLYCTAVTTYLRP